MFYNFLSSPPKELQREDIEYSNRAAWRTAPGKHIGKCIFLITMKMKGKYFLLKKNVMYFRPEKWFEWFFFGKEREKRKSS